MVAIESIDRPSVPGLRRIEGDQFLAPELLEEGRIDEALVALGSVGAAEQQVNWLGYQLMNLGRHEPAVAVFRWNAERHPTHANPWDSLADGYLAVADTAGAVSAYQKVLEAVEFDANADPAALEGLKTRARSQLAALGRS